MIFTREQVILAEIEALSRMPQTQESLQAIAAKNEELQSVRNQAALGAPSLRGKKR